MGAYAQVLAPGRRFYSLSLVIFLASLGLLLFTVVEMRRAFLFPLADYFKMGAPSAILSFNPGHIPLLMLAGLGIWLGYSSLTRLEGRLRGAPLKVLPNGLAAAIMMFLVVDLFLYRGVPASRIAAAGKMGVGRAIDLHRFPGWLEPVGQGINYMALVWHATVLGILIGALLLAVAAGFLKPVLGRTGFKAHLAGAALAVSHPFCSCCATPIGAALYNGGAAWVPPSPSWCLPPCSTPPRLSWPRCSCPVSSPLYAFGAVWQWASS